MERKENGNKKKITERIKSSLFKMFYNLINERSLSIEYSIILMSISFIHLISYTFITNSLLGFSDTFHAILEIIFDLISITPFFTFYMNLSILAILEIIGFTLFILMYIASFIYLKYGVSGGKLVLEFPIQILKILNLFFYFIGFTPLLDLGFNILFCRTMLSDGMCYQSIHLAYVILSCFVIFFSLVINILVSLFYNENSIAFLDSMARLDTNQELFFTLHRLLISFLFILSTALNMKWIFIVYQLLGSLYLLYHYYKYFPYYHPTTDGFYGSCCLSYFIVSVIDFFAYIIPEGYVGYSYLIIILIILCFLVGPVLRHRYLEDLLLNTSKEELKNTKKLELYLRTLESIIDTSKDKKVYQFLISGLIVNHINECQDCPIHTKKELYLPSADQEIKDKSKLYDKIIVYHFISHLYQDNLVNLENNPTLHLAYSNFLSNIIGNVHRATLELSIVLKNRCSLQNQFSAHRFKKKIEEQIQKNNTKSKSGKLKANIDSTVVIEFENNLEKLMKAIESDTNLHLNFWEELTSIMPDLTKINKIGLEIMDQYKEAKSYWTKIQKINSNNSKALKLYGSYSNEILNDIEYGIEILVKGEKLEIEILEKGENISAFEKMFNEDSTVIIMNGNKESQGKISQTSQGITKLLGYNIIEMQGQEINVLIPQVISEHHTKFMNRYFESAKENVIGYEFRSYAIHRSGYIIPCTILINIFKSLENGIQYIGLIKPVKRDTETILVRENGIIDSMSSKMPGILGISPSLFRENKLYIQIICPELFEEVDVEGKKQIVWSVLEGQYKLNFVIPKNLSMYLQQFSKHSHAKTQYLLNDEKENKDNPEIVNIVRTMYKNQNQTDTFPNTNLLKQVIDYTNTENSISFMCHLTKISMARGDILIREVLVHLSSKNKMKDEEDFEESLEEEKNKVVDLKNTEIENDSSSEENSGKDLKNKSNENNSPSKLGDKSKDLSDNESPNPLLKVKKKDKIKKSKGAPNFALQRQDTKQMINDDTGSQASSVTEKMMGTIKNIRKAVFSEYLPPSILRLELTVIILCVILFGLALYSYISNMQALTQMIDEMTYLVEESNRLNQMTALGNYLRRIEIIQQNYNKTSLETDFKRENPTVDLTSEVARDRALIQNLSDSLKITQNYLSSNLILFHSSKWDALNPSAIDISYLDKNSTINTFKMDIWNSILAIVSNSLTANLELTLNSSSSSYFFVITNSFSNILQTIGYGIDNCVDSMKDSIWRIMIAIIIYLSVGSFFIILSIILIFPIMFTVDRNKEEMLLLFLEIPNDKIKQTMERINKFFQIIHNEGEIREEEEDPNRDAEKALSESFKKSRDHGKEEAEKKALISKTHNQAQDSKKRFKSMPAKLHLIIIACILILIVSESYFLTIYLTSLFYNNSQSNRIIELSTILNRVLFNGYLHRAIFEMLVTKGSRTFFGKNVYSYVETQLNGRSQLQESLIYTHSNFEGNHDNSTNTFFENILFKDPTQIIQLPSECRLLLKSVLLDGLEEANTEYWDMMTFTFNKFQGLGYPGDVDGTQSLNISIWNSYQQSVNMTENCFSVLYKELINSIINEQNSQMNSMNIAYNIFFYAYDVLLIIQLIIFLKVFAEITSESLWVTRSFLTILPPDIILNVMVIKSFIVNTARTVLMAG